MSINRTVQRSISSGNERDRATATVVHAALLGILHGHASYSLSISSAHAFAMAPGYVRRYAKAHHLKPPERNVKACLAMKLQRCLASPLPPAVSHSVLRGKAQDACSLLPEMENRIDCILTSPPYLASHTYAKDNWLRHWLLGYNYRDLSPDYLQTGSVARYTTEMQSVICALSHLLRPEGILICIIGHGRKGNSADGNLVNMRQLFRSLLSASSVGLQLEQELTERISSHKRYYHSLSTTNGHTTNDRREYILVARKRSRVKQ
jgi:hypothetical protein